MIILRASQASDGFLFVILLVAVILLLAVIGDGLKYGYHKLFAKRHDPSDLDQDDVNDVEHEMG